MSPSCVHAPVAPGGSADVEPGERRGLGRPAWHPARSPPSPDHPPGQCPPRAIHPTTHPPRRASLVCPDPVTWPTPPGPSRSRGCPSTSYAVLHPSEQSKCCATFRSNSPLLHDAEQQPPASRHEATPSCAMARSNNLLRQGTKQHPPASWHEATTPCAKARSNTLLRHGTTQKGVASRGEPRHRAPQGIRRMLAGSAGGERWTAPSPHGRQTRTTRSSRWTTSRSYSGPSSRASSRVLRPSSAGSSSEE